MAMDKTLAIIREAITIEKFGHDYYNNLRMIVKDKRGQTVLSYLAKLEVDHMMWLEGEYFRQLKALEHFDEASGDSIKLPGIEEIFEVDALPYMYDGTDHIRALEYAVKLEARSVNFYTKAMEFSEDESLKDLFRKLADFEEEHMAFLNHNIQTLKGKGLWTISEVEFAHD